MGDTVSQTKEAVLIVNTHSRNGRALFAKAVELLEASGIHLTATYPVRDPVRLPEVVDDAIAHGSKLIIVGGGDGTLSCIVDSLAYKDVVLGILPLGTGNNFATRTMKIPKTIEGAVEVIAHGHIATVDLGVVNGDYFANTVSLGFSVDLARNTPHLLKRWLGVVAYGIAGLRTVVYRKRFRCTIKLPQTTETLDTHQVIVANGSYFGVAKLAPDAHVGSHQLVVFTMESPSRWHLIKMWFLLFFGKVRESKDARYFVTTEVTIETEPLKYLDVDGEVTTQTPAHFRVAPRALKLMAPEGFGSA